MKTVTKWGKKSTIFYNIFSFLLVGSFDFLCKNIEYFCKVLSIFKNFKKISLQRHLEAKKL